MKKKRRSWDLEIVIKYLGLTLVTPIFMILAYKERGYMAYGGELFIVPLIFVLKALYKTFKDVIKC